MKGIACALALATGSVFAQWSAPQVGSFAVATLKDPGIEKKLRDRFKASGAPVFLIGNPGSGLQQGDIVRFSDKAVLVDADVWQTLASEGALRSLKQAPLVRVKAGADPGAWVARARLVPNPKEKRLYEFGSALLKVLETSVGDLPDGQKLFLSFEGGQMVLTAPSSFLERIKAGKGDVASAQAQTPKEKNPPKGKPRFANRPPHDTVGLGSRLDWTAWAVDDSGGPTYAYKYRVDGQIPSGLAWDAESHRFSGSTVQKGSWAMVLRVQDQGGESDSLVWNLVVAPEAPVKDASRPDDPPELAGFELPWDTLVESRQYSWKLDQQAILWEKLGVTLAKVEADAADARWDGRNLSVRPRREGFASLRMKFLRGGRASEVVRTFPVKRHPSPVFLSRLGGSSMVEGSSRTYRPVAQDGYGGKVSIEAVYSLDAPIDWDGTELRVSPKAPGSWSVKFVARDSLDHAAEQWITFVSEARHLSRTSLETWWVAGAHPWLFSLEFGRGRLGLFTPAPGRIFNAGSAVRQDWPYLMLGSNLLGVEAIRKGHAFTVDMGGTLRLPNAAVLTGGIVGRIQAKYDARPAYPMVFEGEFMGWVQQAIVATDTARLRATMEARNDQAGVDEMQQRYGAVLGQVLSDAFNRRNAVFETRMEVWLPTPWMFQVGGGLWREDIPVSMTMSHRLGGGVRFAPSGRFGGVEATARWGWGPGRAGAAAWWSLRWASGILP